jgi:hypothetical protein
MRVLRRRFYHIGADGLMNLRVRDVLDVDEVVEHSNRSRVSGSNG